MARAVSRGIGDPPPKPAVKSVVPFTVFCCLVAVAISVAAAAQPPLQEDAIAALEERIEALEADRDLLLAVTGTTIAGTILALIVGWFRLVRKADLLARQQMERIVETYPGAVERLVQEHETEARLRREARVGLVSDRLDLQVLLRQHGFKNLITLAPAEAPATGLDPFAAVVLDLTGGLSPEAARALIDRHSRDVFLAYSTAPGRLDLPPGRTTFANSPITLYARLLELLKFQAAG